MNETTKGDKKMKIQDSITIGVEIETTSKLNRTRLADHITANSTIDIQDAGYTHRTTDHWKVCYDSSIITTRDFPEDAEIVSPILKGKEGMKQLKELTEVLENSDQTKVNKSTGLHIHFGLDGYWDDKGLTSDQKLRAMKNLMMMYTKYQIEIDSILAPSRRSTRWAMNLTGRHFHHNDENMEDSISEDRLKSILKNWSRKMNKQNSIESLRAMIGTRYSVINLENWVSRGTIEFRQHQGTESFEKISNWINFLMGMIDRATYEATRGKRITYGNQSNGDQKFNQIFKRKMKKSVFEFFSARRAEFLNREVA
tara:strand:- start:9040 stop:9975 length:936 start_codon:yes stop_codon:yes gene_type:complete